MNPQVEHWPDCWRHHHQCAVAEVRRLVAGLRSVRKSVDEAEIDLNVEGEILQKIVGSIDRILQWHDVN